MSSHVKKGMLVIEGLDGSGKTTLRKSLFRLFVEMHGTVPLALVSANYLGSGAADRLVQGKYRADEIGPVEYLQAVLNDKLATEAFLLQPTAGHRTVIVDRWLLSDMIYVGVRYGQALDHTYRLFADRLRIGADLTLLLDVPAHGAMQRAQARGAHTVRPDWDVESRQRSAASLYASFIADQDRYPLLGQVVILDASKSKSELLHDVFCKLAERDLI